MLRLILSLATLLAFFSAIQAQCNTGEVEVELEIRTDAYGYEGYWELVSSSDNCGTNTILSGGNTLVGCNGAGAQAQPNGGYANSQTFLAGPVCLTEGATYKITYIDDWGDGGFEFTVYVNGYLKETFSGLGSLHNFTFTAEEPPAFNLTMVDLPMRVYQAQGDIDIEADIYNGGTETVTSLTLNYTVDNGSTVSQTVSGLSIAHGVTETVTHPTPWSPTADGEYDIAVWYDNLNGSNTDADVSDDDAEVSVIIGPEVPNVVDNYINAAVVITEIVNSDDEVNRPTDLDFHPILTKKELWIVNKDAEFTGGSTVTISDAGEASQDSEWLRDGNAWHFMSLPTGIAFSDNQNFATSHGIFDANHDGGTPFTGPSLWSSDPAIYAQPSGGNGSHIDMLHATPNGQGIAHESANRFWIFDGYNGDIVMYDFNEDHGPGNDDHSDGEILRYADESVSMDPQEDVPSHLAYDKETDWLYVVDHGNQRVFRIDTKTGTIGGVPSFGPFEPLAQYNNVTGYTWEPVVTTGLEEPCGIAVIDDRMLVSDYATGEVIIYDISSLPATELTRLETEAEGIMGITLGPEGKIWYVDHDAETVNRIDWGATVGLTGPAAIDFRLYPNPTNGDMTIQNPLDENVQMQLFNIAGELVSTFVLSEGKNQLNISALQSGVYIAEIHASSGTYQSRIVLK